MKRNYCLIVFVLFFVGSKAQNTVFACETLTDTKLIHAVIFQKEQPVQQLDKSVSRFTPNVEDLRTANTILFNTYGALPVTNQSIWKDSKKFTLQSAGYIDANGNLIILEQFLNASTPHEFKEKYPNLSKEFNRDAGDFYKANTFLVEINLTNKTIRVL